MKRRNEFLHGKSITFFYLVWFRTLFLLLLLIFFFFRNIFISYFSYLDSLSRSMEQKFMTQSNFHAVFTQMKMSWLGTSMLNENEKSLDNAKVFFSLLVVWQFMAVRESKKLFSFLPSEIKIWLYWCFFFCLCQKLYASKIWFRRYNLEIIVLSDMKKSWNFF